MKKGILLLTALATFGMINAQTIDENHKSPTYLKAEESATATQSNSISSRDAYSAWYSPWNAFRSSRGNQDFGGSISLLYPDSSLFIVSKDQNDDKATRFVGTHAYGSVIDPTDNIFTFTNPPLQKLSRWNDYTIDSMYFYYGYNRTVDSMMSGGNMVKVVDTFIVQLFTEKDLRFSQVTYNSGPNTGESELFASPSAFNSFEATSALETQRIVVTLDENDSTMLGATGWRSKQMVLALDSALKIKHLDTRPTSVVAGYSVTFRPMQPSNFADTLYNSFDNDFPNIYDGITNKHNYAHVLLSNNSGESILQREAYNNTFYSAKSLRYGQTVRGFRNYFLSVGSYHNFGMRISTETLSVDDVDANGFGLGDAYPNPAESGSNINVEFELGQSTSATINIMDLNGKLVGTTSTNGRQGFNTIELPTGNLSQGVYFYNITAGNFTATKKFIIK